MAKPSKVEEQLSGDEIKRVHRLEKLKNVARMAQLAAKVTGHPELAGLAKGAEEGMAGKAEANLAGRQAGKLAQAKLRATGGQAAALQGEGAVGIAKGALSWYALRIAFGALITLVGYIPALLYLDFHFLMSKLGSKLFKEMTFFQKIGLAFANILGIAIVVLAFGLLGVVTTYAACNTTTGWLLNLTAKVVTLGQLDLCKEFSSPSTTGSPDPRAGSCIYRSDLPPSGGCGSLSSCVDVSGYTPTRGCESNGGVCLLAPPAAARARQLIDQFNRDAGSQCELKISSALQVREQISASSCHAPGNADSGTCADFNVIPPTNECFDYFYAAAQKSGAVVSFQDEYVQACLAERTRGGNIHVNF